MRHCFAALLLGLGLAALFGPRPAGAQSLERRNQNTNVSYFYYARPGEATVQVSVWGTVPKPGIYEVALGTSLDDLLSIAGGAGSQTRTEDVERKTTVRLLRREGGARTTLYEAPVDEMLKETSQYPALQDGDVLVVDTVVNEKFQLQDLFTYVGGVASVVLLIDRIVRISN